MINEAAVFEYLNQRAKEHNVASIGVRVGDGLCGNYVVVYDSIGNCKIGSLIAEAVSQLPNLEQSAQDLTIRAQKMESEAAKLRDRAAKLFPQEPKSFGPDD